MVDDIKDHILGHGCGTSGNDCGSSEEVFEQNQVARQRIPQFLR
ncbi:hypothetical protein [Octadecabacter arcticus]|nr:hypothetical protein [Octadecabacter arcticus]